MASFSGRVYGQRFTDAEFLVKTKDSDELVNPNKLSDDKYNALVARITEGVRSIRGRWRVFADVPNLNNTRPEPGKLKAIAKSLKGKPFLYDHSNSVEMRKGRIHSAKAEKSSAGVAELSVVVDITDPDAQLKYVRGELDLFSIYVRGGEAYCSLCKTPAYQGFMGAYTTCEHTPGESYETKKGDQLCEVFIKDAVGTEVSAVNDPAYTDTEILSAYNHAREGGQLPLINDRGAMSHTKGFDDMSDTNKGAPVADGKAPEKPIEVAASHNDELTQLRAQLAESRKREKAAKDTAFNVAFATLRDSGHVMPAQEESLRKYCEGGSVPEMVAFVESFPSRNAKIGENYSAGGDAEPGADESDSDKDTRFLDTMVAEGKMSPEQAAAFKARYGRGA